MVRRVERDQGACFHRVLGSVTTPGLFEKDDRRGNAGRLRAGAGPARAVVKSNRGVLSASASASVVIVEEPAEALPDLDGSVARADPGAGVDQEVPTP